MVLVSKKVNNQWSDNKMIRATPEYIARFDVYVELCLSEVHHIQCNFNKLIPEKSNKFNKMLIKS